ncbi:uncharacterized protein LOC8074381 isoform X1 [Sorghum bicolor]|uniref:Uncharacterized protein n=1 Tax=Sorghum bicolor TaxID=4558 RepID=A0A1B6PTA2_SORBI|nr:uncharacterized protein LOC8074381 isoform X1 [Sorghum bicolor]KXG28902.1 hypothetical protein SORBI_3005G181600 [Sorghum bicolor]|eukprot:XP_002451094.2 uncharacterized protein LOC8074381 isoform X1 [Sorghum bicolor]
MAAGGEGSARWRTANSLEAAATLRRCSTKRKSGKEEASGRMPRRRKEKETASAASACADAEKSAAGAAKNRLPAKDIRWILAQKPEAPPPIYQALKRSNPELVPRPEEEGDEKLRVLYVLARAFYEVEEMQPKFQQWVRSELKEKGYVEVDDDYMKQKAAAQAGIDRDWPILKAKIDAFSGPSEDGDETTSVDSDDSADEEEDDDLDSIMKD